MFITTFYSYKGGVGRTVCLLNVAWELAGRGKKVALLDLDLEAPGLHEARLFETGEGNWVRAAPTVGILHYFQSWKAAVEKADNTIPGTFNVQLPIQVGLGPNKNISLLSSGKDALPPDPSEKSVEERYGYVTSDYDTLLGEFSWGQFYQRPYYGRQFFENVLDVLEEQGYEHLLIDSRTGMTDTQYVSAIQLPDLVVMVSNLTLQSLKGTREVLDLIEKENSNCNAEGSGSPSRRSGREKTAIQTVVVGSPIPQGEIGMRFKRMSVAESQLARPIDYVVDHLPALAFDESSQILSQLLQGNDQRGTSIGPLQTFAEIAEDIIERSPASPENLRASGELMLRVGYWRDASAFFEAASDLAKPGQTVKFDAALGRAVAEANGLLEPKTVNDSLGKLNEEANEENSDISPAQAKRLAEAWLSFSWSQYLQGSFKEASDAARRSVSTCKTLIDHRHDVIDSRLRSEIDLLMAYAQYVEGDSYLSAQDWSNAHCTLRKSLKLFSSLPGYVAQSALCRISLSLTCCQNKNLKKAEDYLIKGWEQLNEVFANDIDSNASPVRLGRKGDGLRAKWYQADAERSIAQGDIEAGLRSLETAHEHLKELDSFGYLRERDPVGSLQIKSRILNVQAMYGYDVIAKPRIIDRSSNLKEFGEKLREIVQEGERLNLDEIKRECTRTLLLAGTFTLVCNGAKRGDVLIDLARTYKYLRFNDAEMAEINLEEFFFQSKSINSIEDLYLGLLRCLVTNDELPVMFSAQTSEKGDATFEIRLWHRLVEWLSKIVQGTDGDDKHVHELNVSDASGYTIWEEVFALTADCSSYPETNEAKIAATVLLVPKLLEDYSRTETLGHKILSKLNS